MDARDVSIVGELEVARDAGAAEQDLLTIGGNIDGRDVGKRVAFGYVGLSALETWSTR